MLNKVKLFLRIEPEYTEEDNLLLGFINEAKEYIVNAVGYEPDENNPIYERAVMLYCTNAYEKRAIQDNTKEAAFGLRHLITQLKYCYDTESRT